MRGKTWSESQTPPLPTEGSLRSGGRRREPRFTAARPRLVSSDECRFINTQLSYLILNLCINHSLLYFSCYLIIPFSILLIIPFSILYLTTLHQHLLSNNILQCFIPYYIVCFIIHTTSSQFYDLILYGDISHYAVLMVHCLTLSYLTISYIMLYNII